MLNSIKEMLKHQSAYQEAADLILEDHSNLDDIILGFENTNPFLESDEGEEDFDSSPAEGLDFEEDVDEDEPIDPGENDGPEEDSGPDDIGNAPIDDVDTDSEGDEDTPPVNDIGDEPMDMGDEPMDNNVPGDGLPEPVSSVTQEPIADEDIASVTLDLQSNTAKDILPTPPPSAASAIADDTMDQRVDSGFGGDSGDLGTPIGDADLEPVSEPSDTPPTPDNDAGSEPIEGDEVDVPPSDGPDTSVTPDDTSSEPTTDGPTVESTNDDALSKILLNLYRSGKPITEQTITEAISLGGGSGDGPITAADASQNAAADAMPDANAGDDSAPADDTSSDDNGEGENAVTSAVRDKVNETEDDEINLDGLDDMDDGSMDNGTSSSGGGEEVAEKIANMQRSMADATEVIMRKMLTNQ